MSNEPAGIPHEAQWLLDRHVRTFEQLEALLLLHREETRPWTADEVAVALSTNADFSAVLHHLVAAELIARRDDEIVSTFCYGPATSELAAAIECLASVYRENRLAVIRRMNANAIARLRSGVARVFTETHAGGVAPAKVQAGERARHPVGLFLDVDGTLLDFAPRPDEVVVSQRVLRVLTRLHAVLGGALALVSGRNVRELDALFAPLKLPCAGLHGSERRDSGGRMHYVAADADTRLDAVRASIAGFVDAHQGLLLEDKGASLAVHFRGRPELVHTVERRLSEALNNLGDRFRLQEGMLVREIVPAAATKGAAVEAFLPEPPFVGRLPVFIGDDITDLDGFAAVERHGGCAIAVGDRIAAESRLPRPAALIDWLEFLVRAEGRYA